ncbi:MAG: substrate-binding domain-containing protein [Pikeienuella sp.]
MRCRRSTLLARYAFAGAALLATLVIAGCDGRPAHAPSRPVVLISGSENKSLFPIVTEFAEERGVEIEIRSLGSVDIMLDIQRGVAAEADIVWPAASLWLALGDTDGVVRHDVSIMRSPVVFWVARSRAEALGWATPGAEIPMAEIVAAVGDGLSFGMTSATQSNSGAMAYLAMLSAAAGAPPVITREHIADPQVKARVSELLDEIDRTSGSSGWLGDLYLQHPGAMAAMFNYEAVGIEVNRALEARGGEPLCAVYPADGLAIADSPLAYLDKGATEDDAKIEAFYLELRDHLLSDPVQAELAAAGRRIGPMGMSAELLDQAVFRTDWCLDIGRSLPVITLPEADVIEAALRVYQSETRRPSEIVFLLDYSGSMKGEGAAQMIAAMQTLLVPDKARGVYLETTPEDVFHAVAFSAFSMDIGTASGGSPEALAALFDRIAQRQPGGGTEIYNATMRGLEILNGSPRAETHSRMAVLLTDGQSDGDFSGLQELLSPEPSRNIPVFAVLFGAASEAQVAEIAEATAARVFDGRKGLIGAFRQARGYAN